MTVHRKRTECRLCNARELECVIHLTPTPPANAFVPESQLKTQAQCFPLDVYFCKKCAHLQLLDVVDPSLLFENYVYVSGTSPSFVKHFENYASEVCSALQIKKDDLVVEVGSNDGSLLQFFAKAGAKVLGIDPAKAIAKAATEKGLETWADFFTESVSDKILKTRGKARAIIANNVFAHADDLSGIVKGIRNILAEDGWFVFEVSYLGKVLEGTLFDTIYHEHLSYHSVAPLVGFFDRHELELFDAKEVATHGGSIRCFVRHKGSSVGGPSKAKTWIEKERSEGLLDKNTFLSFDARVAAVGKKLTSVLDEIKASGKSVVGYGAPAKATTLMYHFNLGKDYLPWIVDDSPLKQGLYTPGKNVPVVSKEMIKTDKPDYLVLLAWNFAEPIMAQLQWYKDGGGKFIVPLPEVRVY